MSDEPIPDPYEEGFSAGCNDDLQNYECPYEEGTEDADAWSNGFVDGCNDF